MDIYNYCITGTEVLLFIWYTTGILPRSFFRSALCRGILFAFASFPWYVIRLRFDRMGEIWLFLLLFLLLLALYEMSIRQAVFLAACVTCLLQSAGIVSYFLLQILSVMQSPGSITLSLVLLELVLFLIKAVALGFHRRELPELLCILPSAFQILQSFLPMILLIASATIYLYVTRQVLSQTDRIVFAALLFVIGIYMYFSVFTNSQRMVWQHRDIENRKIQEYLTKRAEENLAYQSKAETIREMNHNMRNHLLVIQSLEAPEERQSYITNLLGKLSSTQATVYTGNAYVDSILGYKLSEMKEKGIEFSAFANLREFKLKEDIDYCAIWGNSLDNAIEAAACCEPGQRCITLRGYEQGGYMVIRLTNTYEKEPQIEDGIIRSSKGDDHGIGIKSIQYTVEKYDGDVSFAAENGIFTMTILLPSQKVHPQPVPSVSSAMLDNR